MVDVHNQANMAAHLGRRLFCRRVQLISQDMKQPTHRLLNVDNINTLHWTVGYSSRGPNSIQVSSLISRNTFDLTLPAFIRGPQCDIIKLYSYIFQNTLLKIPLGKCTTCIHERKRIIDY